MDDLLKLLDGSIDDVKAGLAALSREDLVALRAAEEGGKTRKGVLEAIEAAVTVLDGPASDTSAADDAAPAATSAEQSATEVQNRIDMNDPVLTGAQLAERAASGN